MEESWKSRSLFVHFGGHEMKVLYLSERHQCRAELVTRALGNEIPYRGLEVNIDKS